MCTCAPGPGFMTCQCQSMPEAQKSSLMTASATDPELFLLHRGPHSRLWLHGCSSDNHPSDFCSAVTVGCLQAGCGGHRDPFGHAVLRERKRGQVLSDRDTKTPRALTRHHSLCPWGSLLSLPTLTSQLPKMLMDYTAGLSGS